MGEALVEKEMTIAVVGGGMSRLHNLVPRLKERFEKQGINLVLEIVEPSNVELGESGVPTTKQLEPIDTMFELELFQLTDMVSLDYLKRQERILATSQTPTLKDCVSLSEIAVIKPTVEVKANRSRFKPIARGRL